jgi:hypothetical protein
VVAAKFDASGFARQLRMRGDHLAIEEEGNIGVEFLLQLMEPLVGAVPRPWLVHGENYLATFPIDPEEIDHRGIHHAGLALVLMLVIGPHLKKTSNVQRLTSNAEWQNLDTIADSKYFRVMLRTLLFFTLAMATNAFAQFTPALLQNNTYWGDGKAEFNIYDAQIARYGVPRPTEVLHILVREPFDPKQLVKPDNPNQPDAIPVLKLNQILHVPTGLYVYQQMHSNFWRVDNAQLLKFSLTSNDSCGNTFKEARREGDGFAYDFHTYWDGMADGKENITVPANGYFYDELPWLVRTIDFSKPATPFEVQLAGTTINSKKDSFVFKPAKISFTSTEREIDVSVQHAGGLDHFILARDFPHLLRAWNAADGSRLKMKRSLKVAYWNYNKPGDRERALADPMLRHPD